MRRLKDERMASSTSYQCVGTLLVEAEKRVSFLLLSGRSLFFVHASPLFLSEASGSFCLF